jgi:hypothetical protein
MIATNWQGAASLLELQHSGIAHVPGLREGRIDAINEWLLDKPRWNGHVKREGVPHDGRPISCWDMHDMILAPRFWEWALSFTPTAAVYLGCAPLLYSINAFESLPSDWDPHPGIEVFHRDQDDDRFVALFLCLTDVYPGDGSHLFKKGSHLGGEGTETIEMCGPRGTAFIADTRGLHCGIRPTSGPRRLAWARWGLSDPPASYVRDRLKPIDKDKLGSRYPSDLFMQSAVRLVAA